MVNNFLKKLYLESKKKGIPVINWEVGILLNFITDIYPIKNVLELGTAVGFSTIWLAKSSQVKRVTTIEINPIRQNRAIENLKKINLENKVNFILGDIKTEIKKINAKYDLIFLDSAKGQYLNLLEDCLRLLNKEGILITDNVYFRGMVIGKVKLIKRYKTIVKRLREYLKIIQTDSRLETIILPISDGLSLSYKK